MGATRTAIAVDAMGGDRAPDAIVAGALQATQELGVGVLLVGVPQQLEASLERHLGSDRNRQAWRERIGVVPSEPAIGMDEEPTVGVRRKPQASINVAMELVRQARADAVVSAGHSGAAMAAAMLRLGRLRGIDRPAIGTLFPTIVPDKSVILLDAGAIVDCRPRYLEQFALMGTIYSQYAMDVAQPQVGLLNIGEEASKGNELALKSYQLLQAHPQIPFAGNVEGRDILSGQFDVVVCDGFVGNVLLKFAEGAGEAILQILREELPRGWRGKLGSALLAPNLKRVKQRVDHAEYGGGLLLGVAGICIISHGDSQAPSIASSLRLAAEASQNQVLERIRACESQASDRERSATPPSADSDRVGEVESS